MLKAKRQYITILGITASILWGFGPFSIARAHTEKGPLHVTNRFPPHLMFLTPSGESPFPLSKNRINLALSVDYTSVFFNEKSSSGRALMDMELTALDISLGYGITDRMSVQMTLPFVSMHSGFLDSFLEFFHSSLALPNYGKKLRPKDEFAYVIETEGTPWFSSQSGGLHMTDSTVSAKISLLGPQETDRMSLSFLYKLKLPTGNANHGFGSGGFDNGFFLLYRFRTGSTILYFDPVWIRLSEPDTDGNAIKINENMYGFISGAEYRYNKMWSLNAQINYYTSPLADKSIRRLSDNSLQLTFGTVYSLSRGADLEFSFSEDLSETVPDFTVYLGVKYGVTF